MADVGWVHWSACGPWLCGNIQSPRVPVATFEQSFFDQTSRQHESSLQLPIINVNELRKLNPNFESVKRMECVCSAQVPMWWWRDMSFNSLINVIFYNRLFSSFSLQPKRKWKCPRKTSNSLMIAASGPSEAPRIPLKDVMHHLLTSCGCITG